MAPPLAGAFATGVIDKDVAHDLRGDGQKLRAARPGRLLLPGQAEVGLVDESRGLECVARALSTQVVSGAPAQLLVDERDQAITRLEIAVAPRLKESRDGMIAGSRRQSFLRARL